MERDIKKELMKMADKDYLKFHVGILNDEIPVIGIRIPMLREYAKKLKKEHTLEYWMKTIQDDYYEEILLKGILIGLYKDLSWEELEKHIETYVSKVTNWSLCDTLCTGLKITKKYKNEMWKLIKKYLKSKKEFDVRFALVMILNYYIEKENLQDIFSIINNVTVSSYYTQMANAWLISYCFIKYYDETLLFYKTNCKVDKWTYNKGIQKAVESYRISAKQKEELKSLRR